MEMVQVHGHPPGLEWQGHCQRPGQRSLINPGDVSVGASQKGGFAGSSKGVHVLGWADVRRLTVRITMEDGAASVMYPSAHEIG